MPTKKAIDQLDRAILRLLAVNARLSLAEIAVRVGLSPTPCWKRIRRMERAGVIRGRVAVLDPAQIGLSVRAFVRVETAECDADWRQRFGAFLAARAEIVNAWRVGGEAEYLLQVMVPDEPALEDFLYRFQQDMPTCRVSSGRALEDLKAGPVPL